MDEQTRADCYRLLWSILEVEPVHVAGGMPLLIVFFEFLHVLDDLV